MKRDKRSRDAAQNNDRVEEPLTMSGGTKRRPLHHSNNCNYRTISISCCLLLLASSSSYLVSASKDKDSGKPSNLRHKNNNNNKQQKQQQKQRTLANSPLCPSSQSTGTYPTKNCYGYIHCTNGIQSSNVIQCSSGTLFDFQSGLCTWPHLLEGGCKVGAELLGDEDTADNNANNEEMNNIDQELHSLDNYCPPNYTGLAPLKDCIGYVDCQNGVAKRSKACSSNNLKFDIMTLSCVANMNENDCEVYYNIDDEKQQQIDDTAVKDDSNNGAPTQSPNDNSKRSEYQTQIISCPQTYTGYKSLPGCTSYIYCRNGVEEGRYNCGSGTIYNGEICVWAQDYQCNRTLIPTYMPSSSPTYKPSNTPSYSPTPLDMNKPIYYPNFMKGICLNDGNQPIGVDKMYLFSTSTGCCSTYFPSNMELCLDATSPTPAPSPTLGAIWYPDYTNNICLSKHDSSPSEYETNFFNTYQECCNFNYITNKSHCLTNKPNVYYPDYYNNICLNDGKQSIWETNLYDTYEECCYMDWIDSDICMEAMVTVVDDDDADGEEGGDNDMELAVYYPDIENNVCHCDGQASEHEMNFFPSYDSCCEFDWFDDIGTTLCKHAKPVQEPKCVGTIVVDDAGDQAPSPPPDANTIYYPDRTNSICLDNDQGFKQAVEYNNIRDCCNDPWITYETCMNHAIITYPAPPPSPSPVVETKPVWNPWYPDYVYQLCRNDGKQSRDTANLFVDMEDCCMAEYMDTNVCMANTVS